MATLLIVPTTQAQQEAPSPDSPAYSTLADLLENEDSRNRLIEELRQLAEREGTSSSPLSASSEAIAADAPGNQRAEEVSLPRRLAETSSQIVGDIGHQFSQSVATVANLFGVGSADGDSSAFDTSAFTNAAINLGLVIAATIALFLILRYLVRPLFSRISQWSISGSLLTPVLRLVLAVGMAAVADILIVVLAYVGGNLIATFAIGESGALSTRASLFLNAFLVIELLKAGLRMLFASRYEGLRLLPISASAAAYWNGWFARLIGLVGYGLLVVVPLLNFYLSTALGQAVGTLIMLGAFVYAVTVVLKNRLSLRQSIEQSAAKATLQASRVTLNLLAKLWHWLAIAYFLMVLLVTLIRPDDALPFVAAATFKTLIIVGIGALLSNLLTQTIGRQITLTAPLRDRLPMLEKRLNAYVPNILRVIRAIILIAVVMLTLNAWNAFDLAAWYASDAGRTLTGNIVSVFFIVVLALAVWIGLASLIEHRLNPDTGGDEPSARARTLLSLFRNALAIAIITMTAMIALSEIGINIGPLIAGAGVLGLAIGFGAQKLVQDIITGVFIQVENAMNTGDVVTVGGITGTAERLSIRSVAIRDLSGTYHIVPFSSVDTVSNYMREFGNHVGEYGIAYRENIDEAIVQLERAFEDLKASEEHGQKLLAPLTVAGVIALADSSVNIRVVIKTTPGDQWAVGRAYNRLVKMRFDEAGIEIPFPHTTLYFGEDKEGQAPAANLRLLDASRRNAGTPSSAGNPHRDIDHTGDDSHRKPDGDDVDEPE
ncbi:mechanosensitive channel protein [Aidingimonas lacisalsi]|uniref:mechanosensitive channel protein n=1 Tax=Aidingimonas lacisalsi TaxID=2604086 RepID=UPI0011D24877|nr:mechanosensitive channel protein [Aidingimonas lacisalsi]